MQARKQRGGGVAPRQKNRIHHQGEQGSERKSEEGDTRNKRKTTKRKNETKKKGKIEDGKRKGQNEENKKKEKGKGVRAALC